MRWPLLLVLGAALPATLIGARAAAQTARPAGAAERPDTSGLRPGAHDVVINGVRFWYRVAGTGAPGAPPVVYLHGGPGASSHDFAVLAGPRLERALRMVYFDQRGSGRSERPWTGHYALDTLVEDIEGLRRALGVPRIALLAHSFGGTLALEYAAKHPTRVSRVVFINGLWDAPSQCRFRRERLAALRPEAYARVAADTVDSAGVRRSDCELEFRAFRGAEGEAFRNALMYPDSVRRKLRDSVAASSGLRNTGEQQRALFAAGLLRYQFTAHARVTMPVLVLAGRHDGAGGGPPQRDLARRLPNATYVEYEQSGHLPFLDEPDRFARDVTAFLTARDARPASPR